MADCQLFGLNPGPHHFVNLALHVANVLLLFLLLQKATGAAWRSLFVAALFAVHPLNVETVAWVAQRKSLLSTFFCLLTIGAYGLYVQNPGWKRYLVVVVGLCLALLSKPMAVTLPLVLLLLDYWPLERYQEFPARKRWPRLLFEKLPLLLLSAASSVITMFAQRAGGALADISALPLKFRIGNAIVSYVGYIQKTVWPANLSVFYPHPEQSLQWSAFFASAVFLIAITAVVLYFREARYLVTGWFLFLVTLVPVIGIVQVGRQAMADRYAYIPCIGLFLMVAWGWNTLVQAIGGLPRAIPAVVALCLITVYGIDTSRYLERWQDGVTLFTDASAVASRPDPALEEAFGDALVGANRYNQAFEHYREACTLRPGYDFCHYNMAEILYHRRQLQDALEQYQTAGRLTKNRDIALSCLINSGEILLKLGDYQNAQRQIAGALQIDPTNSAALQLGEQLLQATGQSR